MLQHGDEIRVIDKQFVAFVVLASVFSMSYWYLFNLAAGGRFVKAIIGALMMITELLMIILAIKSYRQNENGMSGTSRALIFMLLIYNFVHILYALVWDADVDYVSTLGNPLLLPTLLLPCSMLLGLQCDNCQTLLKGGWYCILVAMIGSLVFTRISQYVGSLLIFLMAFSCYFSRGKRILICIFAVIVAVYLFEAEARMAVIRVLMGFMIMAFSYTSLYKKEKIMKLIVGILLLVPLYYLSLYYATGYSVFEQLENQSSAYFSDENVGQDTRTFIYEEVAADLIESKTWLFGKGINGTYYSSYFDVSAVGSDEIAERKMVEVAILMYLLKGGVVQTVLYIVALVLGIWRCLSYRESRAAGVVGLILLAHYLCLFVEEIPRYDLYNISMWFFLGVAYSPNLENLDDYIC